MFDVQDKVVIVTGGLGGIGLAMVKQFLKHGARGVTIVDLNTTLAKQALEDIEQEFGPNKVIFMSADVSDYEAFENVFKKTLSHFKNIDILLNNAGIIDEINWQKEIAVNLNGAINGTLLATENYILNHKSGKEGVILNTASIGGIQFYPTLPIYGATKFGVIGLTGSMGLDVHYNRTKVKLIAICPGATDTEMLNNITKIRPYCEEIVKECKEDLPWQSAEVVAEVALDIVKNATSGTIWVVEDGKGYEFKIPNREEFAKK